jgi:Putative adhesin
MKLLLSTTLLALALAPQAVAQKTRVETKVVTQKTRVETQRDAEREREREQRDAERERERQEREHERSAERTEARHESAPIERTSAADAQAVVSLCLSSGDVSVRGWDNSQVRARAEGAGSLRLLTPNVQPAPRVEVLVSDGDEDEPGSGDCGNVEQVELMVPRGATVRVSTHNGNIDISDIADARVEALSGDVDVRRVSKGVEVSCLSGDISLSDVTGPVRLATVSGSVEARNSKPSGAGDGFEAKSTSGEVTVEHVTHTQVNAATVSGSLLYTGSLARGGSYDFKTISGDVTLELPADASFNLHAKVVVSGDIDTDFPVKTAAVSDGGTAPAPPATRPAPPGIPQPGTEPWPLSPQPARGRPGKVKVPKAPEQVRLDGTVGGGDATVTLTSFSGSLHLRKR